MLDPSTAYGWRKVRTPRSATLSSSRLHQRTGLPGGTGRGGGVGTSSVMSGGPPSVRCTGRGNDGCVSTLPSASVYDSTKAVDAWLPCQAGCTDSIVNVQRGGKHTRGRVGRLHGPGFDRWRSDTGSS